MKSAPHSTDQMVSIFKALADKTRLEIVLFLLERGEAACSEISAHFPQTQPTMSHHFHILKKAGILQIREEGVKHFYSINTTTLTKCSFRLPNHSNLNE